MKEKRRIQKYEQSQAGIPFVVGSYKGMSFREGEERKSSEVSEKKVNSDENTKSDETVP